MCIQHQEILLQQIKYDFIVYLNATAPLTYG